MDRATPLRWEECCGGFVGDGKIIAAIATPKSKKNPPSRLD
ncbi:hypothetical protein [Phormidium sp. CCY1219]|nr:hypothetical protein [Phormidium sp. CCY1219]